MKKDIARHKVTRTTKSGKKITYYRGHGSKKQEEPTEKSATKGKPVIAKGGTVSASKLMKDFLFNATDESDAMLKKLIGAQAFKQLEKMAADNSISERKISAFIKSSAAIKASGGKSAAAAQEPTKGDKASKADYVKQATKEAKDKKVPMGPMGKPNKKDDISFAEGFGKNPEPTGDGGAITSLASGGLKTYGRLYVMEEGPNAGKISLQSRQQLSGFPGGIYPSAKAAYKALKEFHAERVRKEKAYKKEQANMVDPDWQFRT